MFVYDGYLLCLGQCCCFAGLVPKSRGQVTMSKTTGGPFSPTAFTLGVPICHQGLGPKSWRRPVARCPVARCPGNRYPGNGCPANRAQMQAVCAETLDFGTNITDDEMIWSGCTGASPKTTNSFSPTAFTLRVPLCYRGLGPKS